MFLATLAAYYVIVLGRQPLFITCPFCQLVWNLLLQTINLPPNECDSGTDLVESITLRLNPNRAGLQTLGKLLFSAFVWHIRRERNWRIFRLQTQSAMNVVHLVLNTIQTRILHLGITLPDGISSHWNLPLRGQHFHSYVVPVVHPGWRFSICTIRNMAVGLLWSDVCQPLYGAIESSLDYYGAALNVMEIIPHMVQRLSLEADSALLHGMRCPSQSPWIARFKVRKIVSSIQCFEDIQFSTLHPLTIRFSKKVIRHRAPPIRINALEMDFLFNLVEL